MCFPSLIISICLSGIEGQKTQKNSYSCRCGKIIYFFSPFKDLLNQKAISTEILALGNSKICSPSILQDTTHFQTSLVKWTWSSLKYDLLQQYSGLYIFFIAALYLYQNEKHCVLSDNRV